MLQNVHFENWNYDHILQLLHCLVGLYQCLLCNNCVHNNVPIKRLIKILILHSSNGCNTFPTYDQLSIVYKKQAQIMHALLFLFPPGHCLIFLTNSLKFGKSSGQFYIEMHRKLLSLLL